MPYGAVLFREGDRVRFLSDSFHETLPDGSEVYATGGTSLLEDGQEFVGLSYEELVARLKQEGMLRIEYAADSSAHFVPLAPQKKKK